MSLDDEKYGKNRAQQDQDEDASGSGASGSTVAFRDFITVGEKTREKVTPEEERRLLLVHKETNATNIKKQKEKLADLKALKEGKKSLSQYREGLAGAGSGSPSEYEQHPALANMSGMDPEVSYNPTENEANTNEGQRQELSHEYQLTYQPQLTNQPKFTPKPTPFSR